MIKKLLPFFLALFIHVNSTAQLNLTKGLVAYFPFNGNTNDESGNKNNPVFSKVSFVADRKGNAQSAGAFNGQNQYVKVKNNPSLNFNRAFSISVWVMVNDFYEGLCHGNRIIMKGATDYKNGNYFLTYDDNYYTNGNNCYTDIVDKRHQTFYGPNTSNLFSKEYVPVKKWQLLTLVYDGKTIKLFIDCNLYSSGNCTDCSFINDDDLYIGRMENPKFPYWFNGCLDELRIYNRALNADEIAVLCEKKENPENILPSVDFTYTVTSCNKVQFSVVNAKNIKNYRWNMGDKSSSAKESFSHIYQKTGAYTAELIATGSNGKQITVTKSISISKPDANFTTVLTPEKNKAVFTAGKKQAVKYSWHFGDGTTSSKSYRVSHTYKTPGTYTVKLIAVNKNGCSDTVTDVITIATPALVPAQIITAVSPDSSRPIASTAVLPEQRQNTLIKTIEVTSDSLTVSFYDNAEVDGDSVTIVYNNEIIIQHLFLTSQPKTFKLAVSKTALSNELVMYAENLGSIPPNTALMIIYDGNTRHELNISSTKNSNGMVSFIFKQ